MVSILIVDDDPEISLLTKIRLESNGFHVYTANTGAEGLRLAVGERPNLILLDIRIPDMDGWTFLHQLKATPAGRAIPVIMLSSETQMNELFSMGGAADFIVKPYQPDELIAKIRRTIHGLT